MKPVSDWLGDADWIADLGRRLCERGVPADRLALYRRTLHPEILARATLWAPGRPVEIFDRQHGLDLSAGFPGSPLDLAMADGTEQALTGPQIRQGGWGWADPFRAISLTELRLHPLSNMAALVIATGREGGFSAGDLPVIQGLGRMTGRKSRASLLP